MKGTDEYIAGEKEFAPILKTGDRFIANTTLGGSNEYEFVGYAPFCPTGCAYLILKNVRNGHHTTGSAEKSVVESSRSYQRGCRNAPRAR